MIRLAHSPLSEKPGFWVGPFLRLYCMYVLYNVYRLHSTLDIRVWNLAQIVLTFILLTILNSFDPNPTPYFQPRNFVRYHCQLQEKGALIRKYFSRNVLREKCLLTVTHFMTKIGKMLIIWPLSSKAQLVMCYNWLLFWPNSELVTLITADPYIWGWV